MHLRLAEHLDTGSLVSRDQAREVLREERAAEADAVTVDFTGLTLVGVSFADEVFRVWARAHPGVALQPINMAPLEAHIVRDAMARREKERDEGYP